VWVLSSEITDNSELAVAKYLNNLRNAVNDGDSESGPSGSPDGFTGDLTYLCYAPARSYHPSDCLR
jgi:hypothetical protein